VKPIGARDYAALYPTYADRVPGWRDALAAAPRTRSEQRWTRDLPAVRLRRSGDTASKLLAPIGYRYTHNRFNGLNRFPAFYLSDGQSTVFAEVFGGTAVRHGKVGPPEAPRLTLPIDACLEELIDLRDASVLRALQITEGDLTQVFELSRTDSSGRFAGYELPQCLGEIGNELGLSGFLYTSAQARVAGYTGTNVVIFTDNLSATNSWYQGVDPVTGHAERWP
jgi:hypothetical protein